MAVGGIGPDMGLISNPSVSKNTAFNKLPQAFTDLILRVRQSENHSRPHIFMAPTESVARPIHNLMVENAVLKGVVYQAQRRHAHKLANCWFAVEPQRAA